MWPWSSYVMLLALEGRVVPNDCTASRISSCWWWWLCVPARYSTDRLSASVLSPDLVLALDESNQVPPHPGNWW
jgi:hypothetical protein